MALNKALLIDKIAVDYDLTKVLAKDIVDNIFDTIAESLLKDEEVSIANFGIFKISERIPRLGRNPATGETIKLPASRTLRFRPSNNLKSALNAKTRRAAKKAKPR